MAFRKISRKSLLLGCSDPGAGDGCDPRYDRDGQQERPEGPRKLLQLCGQVARTLEGVLATCGDEVLRDLVVVSVVPAPSSARLLVSVGLAPSAPPRPVELIEEHLQRAAGLLRCEVAGSVTRRRAPDLVFRVATR
jgi:hypothetical protein